jgi:hypothetical protein
LALKINIVKKGKRGSGVWLKEVEHLPSKHNIPVSIPRTEKERKRKWNTC